MENYEKYVGKKIGRAKILQYLGNKTSPNDTRYSIAKNFYCLCDCGKKFFCTCDRFIFLLNKNSDKLSCGSCSQTKDGKPTKKPNKYTFDDKYAYIHLDNIDDVAIIDREDYEKVKNYRWSYSNGYFRCHIIKDWKSFNTGLHRVIMDLYDNKFVVDHINRNTLDNRKENLRIVTKSQNAMNCKLKYKHKYGCAGIYKTSTGWSAKISVENKTKSLGIFKTIEEAIQTRKDAEIKYFKMNRVYW